jgi:hypothetical protein
LSIDEDHIGVASKNAARSNCVETWQNLTPSSMLLRDRAMAKNGQSRSRRGRSDSMRMHLELRETGFNAMLPRYITSVSATGTDGEQVDGVLAM